MIWKSINSLRRIKKNRDVYYEQLVAGHTPKQKLQKYLRADKRILNIVSQFAERETLEYLRGLVQNYEMH